MTRKDFELIAAALRTTRPPAYKANLLMQHTQDACALADALATINPRFDRERFLKACGVVS